MLSIVIPILDEAVHLKQALQHLTTVCPGAELIVVDGGSRDGGAEIAERHPGVRLLRSERGRALQMNAGAEGARGEMLLFLHADTRLPHGAVRAIEAALGDPAAVGGRFDVRVETRRSLLRLVTTCMNLRSRLTGIATGDQAIFVRRATFVSLGGYPGIPLMEDVEFSRRLKRAGRLACLRIQVTTSARKWEREGVLRTILLMWSIRFLYWVGVSPARLHQWYYPDISRQP